MREGFPLGFWSAFYIYILYRGQDKRLSHKSHKLRGLGSTPRPARVAINQPPRGATWVTQMIEYFNNKNNRKSDKMRQYKLTH